ncbi:pre-B lymphocyte protein 3 [Ornithorhynchus anatinus]|uniref:pre-B lymphocyte protein 3 n=1 Tax=Ornithorhynchus anatinus TaxID=9258 RepID=UPI0010A8B039|nr:pre-B lymphocyte protein 3 [Ornithorhynchus anatinus]
MTPCSLTLLFGGALLAASQPQVIQQDAVLVFPGQTAKLFCALSPGFSIQDYGVSWYQQRAGRSPRYLLYYHSQGFSHRPRDVPNRFSASKDADRNACILTIREVQPEDDAHYFCSVGYSVFYQ